MLTLAAYSSILCVPSDNFMRAILGEVFMVQPDGIYADSGDGPKCLSERVLAEWIFHQYRYQAIEKGSQCWIRQRELAVEADFDSWDIVTIL
jgi:hypothetical protein